MPNPLHAPCLDLPGVRHGFFTREGGVSTGLYESLNCGPGSGDDPGSVRENRARVSAYLGSGREISTVHQVHGATAVVVDGPVASENRPRADAIVTRTPGVPVGILTADCAPVLFAAPASGVVAAAHAGWRGAVGGVIEATARAMLELGADPKDIRAVVGPCIHQASYEVGPEFESEVLALDASNARFFARTTGEENPRFDLLNYVVARLYDAGVETVSARSECTYRNESRFYSFRRSRHRGEPDYGRQISAIVVI